MTSATSLDEVPVFIEAASNNLFGIVTRPTTRPNGMGVILLSGAGRIGTVGRNRIWVRLARQLAPEGFHVIRLDYRGVGESGGGYEPFALDDPFAEDVVAAAKCLLGYGVDHIAVVGMCFGGRSGLAASSVLPCIRGVAMLASPFQADIQAGDKFGALPTSVLARKAVSRSALVGVLHRERRVAYRRILRQKARRATSKIGRRLKGEHVESFSWVSPAFTRQVEALLDRDGRVLLVYGEGDEYWRDLQRGAGGPFAALLSRGGNAVTIAFGTEPVHSLRTLSVQDFVVEHATEWLQTLAPETPA